MSDDIDRAQAREEENRVDALANQARRAALSGKTVSDSARTCHVCDESIPDARRRALPGVQTCVQCQAELEQAGDAFASGVWR